MCFRPAAIETSIECPNCGKKINPVMGNVPNECPFCSIMLSASDATPAIPGVPSTPKAPNAPGVSGE
ncbi:hypothetical protein C1878_15475 [Gordonibacter sp. 28C]|nr:hypothetical protein C1878_15475 [Gordonibacter sp. 28C]